MIKQWIQQRLASGKHPRLERFVEELRALGRGHDLDRLGRIYGTDKVGHHTYTPHYRHHFRPLRFRRLRLLEIGVGGYRNPRYGGNSLRMWKKYFPWGRITSLDIHDKSLLQERRIRIYQGSQVDRPFMEQVVAEAGPFDIIIDDGSHRNEHVIESFHILFPTLKDGGIYVVEDIQTSYWEDYGGSSDDLNDPRTSMGFFKQLADGLNHAELIRPDYQPTYYDRHIRSMHFYHNMVFIYKGDNTEPSNIVRNNQR
jgi:cephalosporin hydroxylase